jgi:hypothetical protein
LHPCIAPSFDLAEAPALGFDVFVFHSHAP